MDKCPSPLTTYWHMIPYQFILIGYAFWWVACGGVNDFHIKTPVFTSENGVLLIISICIQISERDYLNQVM